MRLERLEISRRRAWESRPGELEGKAQFTSTKGEVTLNFDQKLAQEILDLCAAGLVRTSRDIAENLCAEVIEAASDPLLENES